jgi:hypothetical protein
MRLDAALVRVLVGCVFVRIVTELEICHISLLQKQFLVSAGNQSLVPVSKSDTLCMTQNGPSLVLAGVNRHKKLYLWCRLFRLAYTKNQFSIIKNTRDQI